MRSGKHRRVISFRIAIDPLFPPPETASATANRAKHADLAQENKFQLIFDERYDGQQIRELMKDRNGKEGVTD